MKCLAYFEEDFHLYIYIFILRNSILFIFSFKRKLGNLLFPISKYFPIIFYAIRNSACCLVQSSSGERETDVNGDVYYVLFCDLLWWITTINVCEKNFNYLLYLLNYHDSRVSRKENRYIDYNKCNKSFAVILL